MGTRAHFPAHGSAPQTPPNYKPEAFAVRFKSGARDIWKKYPSRQAVDLGVRSGETTKADGEWHGDRWVTAPMTVEIWEWFLTGTGGAWYLHETRIYRTSEKNKREMFRVRNDFSPGTSSE